ncbi:hypothetical protein N752_28105 [Desulforamulus aquiferis]|nr:hypothetical protein N752_28105 [Desulforamulus aquiferis]
MISLDDYEEELVSKWNNKKNIILLTEKTLMLKNRVNFSISDVRRTKLILIIFLYQVFLLQVVITLYPMI